MSGYIELSSANFESEVEKSTLPVLIDFWAPWCGPCRMLGPVIEQVAQEYKDKLKVCKVNTDNEAELAQKFNIVSIPTLMIWKDGKLQKQQSGALPKEGLVKFFNEYL